MAGDRSDAGASVSFFPEPGIGETAVWTVVVVLVVLEVDASLDAALAGPDQSTGFLQPFIWLLLAVLLATYAYRLYRDQLRPNPRTFSDEQAKRAFLEQETTVRFDGIIWAGLVVVPLLLTVAVWGTVTELLDEWIHSLVFQAETGLAAETPSVVASVAYFGLFLVGVKWLAWSLDGVVTERWRLSVAEREGVAVGPDTAESTA